MNIDPQKIRPQKIAAFLLMAAIGCHLLLKPDRFIPTPWNYLGLIFILDGFMLMLWTHKLFIKTGTPVSLDQHPDIFIKEGLYETIRNPMYVGGLVMFFGIWILVGTWPFLVAAIILFLILDRIYVPFEEKIMKKFFGQDYADYTRKTRKWL